MHAYYQDKGLSIFVKILTNTLEKLRLLFIFLKNINKKIIISCFFMAIMLEVISNFAHFLHKFNKVLKIMNFFENSADFLTLL